MLDAMQQNNKNGFKRFNINRISSDFYATGGRAKRVTC